MTSCHGSPLNQFMILKNSHLTKQIPEGNWKRTKSVLWHYLIMHRFNVTQHLHSLYVIGCCSPNTVWFTRTSFILCVWDVTAAASKALQSSQCFSAYAPSQECFIYFTTADEGMGYECVSHVGLMLVHVPSRWHMTLAWDRKGKFVVVFFSLKHCTLNWNKGERAASLCSRVEALQPYGGCCYGH